MKKEKAKDWIREWELIKKAGDHLSDVHYIESEIEDLAKRTHERLDGLRARVYHVDEDISLTESEKKVVIADVSILNASSFEQCKDVIKMDGKKWWLRPYPGEGGHVGCPCVSDSYIEYKNVKCESVGVRPLLKIIGDHEMDIGNKIDIAGLPWTVLTVFPYSYFVLCDEIIAERRMDAKNAVWNESELKTWLEEWVDYLVMGLENIVLVKKSE